MKFPGLGAKRHEGELIRELIGTFGKSLKSFIYNNENINALIELKYSTLYDDL